MRTAGDAVRRGAGAIVGGAIVLWAASAGAGELDDLRARNDALADQLRRLTEVVEQLKADSARTAQPASVDKAKAPVQSGNEKVKLALSGQVNRAVLGYDDGADGDVRHVDNSHSSSRFRFVGTGTLDDDISAGTKMEMELRSNPSSGISQGQAAPVGDTTFNKRVVELFLQSKRFGRLTLGHGSTATDGIADADLSRTDVAGKVAVQDFAGGLFFRNTVTGTLSAVRIGNAFSHLNGLGRDERLRYDTPNFGGFVGSLSSIDGGAADAALSFGGDVGGTKVRAAVGYGNASSRQGFTRTTGSLSALLPVGASLTVAIGKQGNETRDDGSFLYGKLGYQTGLWAIGKTAIAVDAYQGENIRANGETATAYGAQVVQNVDRLATELYVGYRHHELEAPAISYEPIRAVLGGARVKF